jgi:hypothetical protein
MVHEGLHPSDPRLLTGIHDHAEVGLSATLGRDRTPGLEYSVGIRDEKSIKIGKGGRIHDPGLLPQIREARQKRDFTPGSVPVGIQVGGKNDSLGFAQEAEECRHIPAPGFRNEIAHEVSGEG